jgi:FkbM family methyltransferase
LAFSLIGFFQSTPSRLVKPKSFLDKKMNYLTSLFYAVITIKVESAKFKIRDLEGLYILDPKFEDYMLLWFHPKEGEVLVDVGPHIGKYAISAAKKIGNTGQVIALEPHPITFKVLRKNIKINHLKNVTALNVAAWKEPAILKFYPGDTPAQFSVRKAGLNKTIDVEAKRVDDVLIRELKLNRVDWVKLDVEKAELEVLEGLTETLRLFKPKIFVEGWAKNINEVKALLKTSDYQLIAISDIINSKDELCVYYLGVPNPN